MNEPTLEQKNRALRIYEHYWINAVCIERDNQCEDCRIRMTNAIARALAEESQVKPGHVRFEDGIDVPINGRIPKTIDGSYVVPGSGHVFIIHNEEVKKSFNWSGWAALFWVDFKKGLETFTVDPSNCYSTQEAAEAFQKHKSNQDYNGIPCTCFNYCSSPCKGTCNCEACKASYGDFLSSE